MGQRWAVLCSLTAICGCAHPYLKAGGTLAASLEKGDSAIGALMAMEVTTARTYPYARSMIGDPSAIPLETRFVRLVCLPYLSELPAERVALANLEKYRVFLALKAADPEDKDLASLLASLSKAGTRFVPADPDNAADELRKQDLEGFEECKARVQVTYSAPEPAHALVLPLLAAWPKVKEFLTYLAVEANRAEREGAIVESLKNDDTQNAIERSLAALSSSAQASGQLDVLLVKQKQMLLWSAHAYFISLGGSEMPGPISTSAYLDLTKKGGKNGGSNEGLR